MCFARTADNLQLYLYLCEVRFGTSAYPIFYVPASARFDDAMGEFVIDFDPHLFVNKRAVDFIIQEQKGEAARLTISPVDDRIIYLDGSMSFTGEMESVLKKLVPVFEVVGDLDIRNHRLQSVSSPSLKLANSAYFAIFDKSDEALLNDYEELLNAVTDDQKGAGFLFENIIKSFLLDEPKSVRKVVDKAWDDTQIPERLVAVSPIPINEEQRKILTALRDPDCKYLAIQGPPGTGKSHTITAIAFDCILNGSNILVLSDKQEALDVVQDKLKVALDAVRHGGDDFPNPILRLGKVGGSYNRLISQSAQEKIRMHLRAENTNAPQLETETTKTHTDLKQAIESTIQAYSNVSLSDIEELHRLEVKIVAQIPGYTTQLQEPPRPKHLLSLHKELEAAAAEDWMMAVDFISQQLPAGSIDELLIGARALVAAMKISQAHGRRGVLSLFSSLGIHHQRTLIDFVNEYENLKMPVFGWLFRGAKLRDLNTRAGASLPCTNPLDLHRRLADLKTIVAWLDVIREALKQENVAEEHGEHVYRLIVSVQEYPTKLSDVKRFLNNYYVVFGNEASKGEKLAAGGARFKTISDFMVFLLIAVRYSLLWQKICSSLESAPALDYVGTKSKLERLYTAKMTHEIDRRFIDFVDNNRATAKTLGGVIKAKQQFPQDKFESVKKALPCIIAGIREFAEYVPLKEALFDVVVIDEASQVSVAQAFPVLLRAKKVVVFGDQKQFSNVKSAQASNMLNAGYLTDIEAHFRANVSRAADKIQRLKQFDVKKSILEFFDLIAGYHDMLRKHFRGYQELISFSSKYFYDGQLQAIKVRGKPLDEVIGFTILPHEGTQERHRNVNTPEAEFILKELRKLVDDQEDMTVGVITPFREQLRHLTRILYNDAYADRFESELKLKVMTFDTCQGEERDIIFYSMVATPNHDALNYVFPVDITGAAERVEDLLKMQRLNVGFSRAKERIHFVLSKPVDEFRGSIGRALMHYKNILDTQAVPEANETDPASPMERKVLDWIQKTIFFQQHQDDLELIAQFPIGNYLRQLDPFYQHPAYRCDFLLRYFGEEGMVNIVIEYDGFGEHFVEHKRIHDGNYDQYYRPADIERQMVIESYGYKFLRINRFNLGRDPVEMLSQRLLALVNSAMDHEQPQAVENIREAVEQQANGDAKHCRKCNQVKPREAFFDQMLRSGKGGNGQICMACKALLKNAKSTSSGHRRNRRPWKRRTPWL